MPRKRKASDPGGVPKPAAVEADPFKSAKWDELTAGRSFRPSDAPALALLCQWYKIADAAMGELDGFGGQTAYQNDMGDLRQFPQIGTLKTASAEIRQLNKQLGINDEADGGEAVGGGSVLTLVQGNRKDRRARATG